MLYDYLPLTLRFLLGSLLWAQQPLHSANTGGSTKLRFQLRQVHGTTESSRVVFSDIPTSQNLVGELYEVETRPLTAHKPASLDDFFASRFDKSRLSPWDETDVEGPNVRDRETLLMLAKMTSNAYTQPGAKDWYDIGPDWNNVS